MARNGTGTYSLPAGNPVVTGTTISSTVHNTTLTDIASALTGSIAANGETPITANIPMHSFKLTGLSAGSSAGDSVRYEQFASPPAIGGTAAAAGTFTTLAATNGGKFTGNPTIDVATSNTRVWATAGNPAVGLIDSTRAADARHVEFVYTAGTFTGRYINDTYSAATAWVAVVGTSASITSITFTGTTINLAGDVASTGSIKSSSEARGVGYATGAGGTVTQLTSKSTSVTLNKICGQITMHNAALAAGATIGFPLVNSTIEATDVVLVTPNWVGAQYDARTYYTTAGECRINVTNISGGSLSDAVLLNFVVVKAVAA